MVGLKPKPKFMGLFQFMGAKSKTPMRPENNSSEPDEGSELSLTGWWRRGREPVSKEFSGVPGKLNDPGPGELGI